MERLTGRVMELLNTDRRHAIVVAPRHAGKTRSMWYVSPKRAGLINEFVEGWLLWRELKHPDAGVW